MEAVDNQHPRTRQRLLHQPYTEGCIPSKRIVDVLRREGQ